MNHNGIRTRNPNRRAAGKTTPKTARPPGPVAVYLNKQNKWNAV